MEKIFSFVYLFSFLAFFFLFFCSEHKNVCIATLKHTELNIHLCLTFYLKDTQIYTFILKKEKKLLTNISTPNMYDIFFSFNIMVF